MVLWGGGLRLRGEEATVLRPEYSHISSPALVVKINQLSKVTFTCVCWQD